MVRFNRTFMELKQRYGKAAVDALKCFNRTFMELKLCPLSSNAN